MKKVIYNIFYHLYWVEIKQNIKKWKQIGIAKLGYACYTVIDLRYCKGEKPTRFLKASEKRCRELNPTE